MAARCAIAAAVVQAAWGLVPPMATPRQTSLRAVHPKNEGRPEYVPGVISDPGYVRIFDTTLRDVEQSPGATLTSNEKLDIARMLAKLGGEVEGMTSHFIALVMASRVCAFAFWFYGYQALKPRKKDGGGMNIAGYVVFASHAMQLLLSADFMQHYLRSCWRKVKLVLPGSIDV